MNDHIVAGVMPLHIEQAKARAEAVQTYISKHYRNGAERDRLAASLGLTKSGFQLLVQAWKTGKGINGLGRYSLSRRPKKQRRSAEITNGVIALKGAAATLKEVKEAVLAQCAKEQVEPPCKSTVHDQLMKARARMQPQVSVPMVLVGDVLVNLACHAPDGSIVRLRLAVAVEVASKRILAYRVVPDQVAFDIKDLLRELKQVDASLPLLLDQRHRNNLQSHETRNVSYVPMREIKNGMISVFGQGFTGFPFIHQQGRAGPLEAVLKRQKGRTVELTTAVQALEAAIKRHNRGAQATLSTNAG